MNGAGKRVDSGIVIPEKILIGNGNYRKIVEDCVRSFPREACGLISGYKVKSGLIVIASRVYPTRNSNDSATSYKVAPEDQVRIMLDMESEGLELVGIYHSHPDGRAYPSSVDIEQAFYPEAVYLIVGMKDGIEVRGYCLRSPRLGEILQGEEWSPSKTVVDVEVVVEEGSISV